MYVWKLEYLPLISFIVTLSGRAEETHQVLPQTLSRWILRDLLADDRLGYDRLLRGRRTWSRGSAARRRFSRRRHHYDLRTCQVRFQRERTPSARHLFSFLSATKHLYNWLRLLVGRLVCRSVTHWFNDQYNTSHLFGLLGLVYLHNSGGHLNVIVSLAFLMLREMPPVKFVGYIFAQIFGAAFGAYTGRVSGIAFVMISV